MGKKIWIMNHYATNMYFDQNGRHYWFAKLLREKGYEPAVFCANTFHNKKSSVAIKRGKYIKKMDGDIPYIFVKTKEATGNGMGRILNMLCFFLNLFPAAKGYKKAYGKPDVILASSVHPLTMAAGIKIAKKLHVPCICEIRDLWPEAIFSFGKAKENSLLGKILTAGEHWIYKKADALIFTKEGDTDYLKEKHWLLEQGGDIDIKKCHYINNGVNLELFDRMMAENKTKDEDLADKNKFNVVYTGMIRPVNHVGNLLDCAKLLKDEKEIQFLIYGDGNQLEELKERVKREKIANVRLKGFIPKNSVPYVLSRSSVNILNYAQNQYNWSRGNSSNKLFEYLASGKPVISTVKMGYCPIARYQCGYSIDKCEPQSLADMIRKIKNMDVSEYDRLCKNARAAAGDFDFHVLTGKLEKVIESVVK